MIKKWAKKSWGAAKPMTAVVRIEFPANPGGEIGSDQIRQHANSLTHD